MGLLITIAIAVLGAIKDSKNYGVRYVNSTYNFNRNHGSD